MDAVSSNTSSSAVTANTANPEEEKGSVANSLAGDFDTFLKLLTAQMENQDPLEPTNNTEFVAQLASFSAVEQQVEANSLLTSIRETLGGGSTSDLAGWIQKEVLVKGGLANFDGQPIGIEVTPDPEAERSELVVRDAAGSIIARQLVGSTASDVSWDGKNDAGSDAEPGLYRFSVERHQDGSVKSSEAGSVFSKVSEVRLVEGEAQLTVDGGVTLKATDVTAIR